MAQAKVAQLRKIRQELIQVESGQEKEWLNSRFDHARRSGRFVEMGVEIKPLMAAAMLECNAENRKISDAFVARYAADMRAGRWLLNGEVIKFSMGGALNDGQHRLYAAFAYDVTFSSDIAFGLTRESRMTVDQGKKRSAADIIGLSGKIHYAVPTAAAIRILLRLQGITARPSAVEVAEALEHYSDLSQWHTIAGRLYQVLKAPNRSQAAALAYLFGLSDREM